MQMKIFNITQVVSTLLLGLIVIWFVRDEQGDNMESNNSGKIEALDLPEFSQPFTWKNDNLRSRMLAFVPSKEIVEADVRAKEDIKKALEPVSPPEPVDKTLKPMYSMLDVEHQVGLLAIIQQDNHKYAILQKINFASQISTKAKIRENETFEGLTLSIRSQTQVVLKNTEREIQLNLFKSRNT